MAPKVQVPCDFGREYINVPEHCNLKLKLKNGEDYLVNSVIMSYNSPEIKRLTTELHQTSLEMDDFDDNAVYCFVDALYTGELEMIDKDIFTDVYKMGRVFEVSWLLSRCTDYFKGLITERDMVDSTMDDKTFTASLSKCLFAMAWKIQTQNFSKEHMFMDIFSKSLRDNGDRCEFIKRLVGDTKLNELSKPLAEHILHIVCEESDVLVEGMIKSLRNHPLHNPLGNELKYMLESCDLALCYQKSQKTYDEFFDLLDDLKSLTREDLKLINCIHRQCMKKVTSVPLADSSFSAIQATVTLPKNGEMSNNCDYRHNTVSYKSAGNEPTVTVSSELSTASKPDFNKQLPLLSRHLDMEKQSVKTNRSNNFKEHRDICCRVTGRGSQIVRAIKKFDELNCGSQLRFNMFRAGYREPTLVQKYALPIISQDKDLMVCAPTGSGKTAAFVLPMVNIINAMGPSSPGFSDPQTPEALVITPTGERALHIHRDASRFSFSTMCKAQVACDELAVEHQQNSIRRGCNILIGTPHHLKQFVTSRVISLQNIMFLVLDEADRMLDMGIFHEFMFFTGAPGMPPKQSRQTLLFSASFRRETQELARNLLKPDYLILTLDNCMVDYVQYFTQQVLKVEEQDKLWNLMKVLKDIELGSSTLILVQTNDTADFLESYLSPVGYDVRSLVHGKWQQREREITLKDFRTGVLSILVATSVAAYGLNFEGVTHVIDFDMPNEVAEIDEYVRRIGETRRSDRSTVSSIISFFDPEQNIDLAFLLIRILSNAEQDVAIRAVGTDGWKCHEARGNAGWNLNLGPASEELW